MSRSRLLQLTAPDVRVVTVEDNPETRGLGPRNTVNLFYGDSRAKLTAEAAVQAALRMRPDEIHLAEIRGAEAFAFLRAVAAGHPGSITTWHADEGKEIAALVAMVKQHEAGRALDDVEERIRAFVDIIVWCDRNENGFCGASGLDAGRRRCIRHCLHCCSRRRWHPPRMPRPSA